MKYFYPDFKLDLFTMTYDMSRGAERVSCKRLIILKC